MPSPRSSNITLPNKLKMSFFKLNVTKLQAQTQCKNYTTKREQPNPPQKNSTWALMIISLLDSISGWWEGNKGPDWHFHVNETQDVR